MSFQLGLDTGGTFTDAVVIDEHQTVIASAKSLTTHHDLIQGLRGAVSAVLAQCPAEPISLVALSTTLATNALVEGHGRRVALILIGYSEQQMQRARLSEALGNDLHVFIEGGHRSDGQPATRLDTNAINAFVSAHADDVDAFAVSSMFSVRNPEHEREAQQVIESLCQKPISCGHTLSSGLDAPRRALTALLNARLIPMIGQLLDAASELLSERSIDAPLMIVKGDGSLIHANVARQAPVETILSGPAASVVGAQFLLAHHGHAEANVVVSDMGGTTTDIAVLEAGIPKLDPNGATVGGWRTMVQAVAVRTFGLGGDSHIQFNREARQFSIGPLRVLPLSRLALQFDQCVPILQQQLEHGWARTHDAQFALLRAEVPSGITGQQKELCAALANGPVALQTVFKDQTLDRALNALVQRGIVQIAAFTPTDACLVLDRVDSGDKQAAVLGAKLQARYASENLGPTFEQASDFAGHIQQRVAEQSAMSILETLLQSPEGRQKSPYGVPKTGLSKTQQDLLRSTFAQSMGALQLSARIQQPIVALGAPVAAYYPQCAELLNTTAIVNEHASVANALGAVVGTVRQQVCITLSPAGGKRVRVHDDSGPQIFDALEEAAAYATQRARELAVQRATDAGADQVDVTVERVDNTVEDNGNIVFFGSEITASAMGRPAHIAEASAAS